MTARNVAPEPRKDLVKRGEHNGRESPQVAAPSG